MLNDFPCSLFGIQSTVHVFLFLLCKIHKNFFGVFIKVLAKIEMLPSGQGRGMQDGHWWMLVATAVTNCVMKVPFSSLPDFQFLEL